MSTCRRAEALKATAAPRLRFGTRAKEGAFSSGSEGRVRIEGCGSISAELPQLRSSTIAQIETGPGVCGAHSCGCSCFIQPLVLMRSVGREHAETAPSGARSLGQVQDLRGDLDEGA